MWRYGLAAGSFLCAVLVLVAFSQDRPRPPRGFGPPVNNAILLGIPEVQQELGLTEKKKEESSQWATQAQQELRDSFGSFDFRNVQGTEEEREKRMAEMQAKSDAVIKQADARLSKILDLKQLNRLNQLRLQREGVLALQREDVAKALKLTEQQKRDLQELPPPFPFAPPDVRKQTESEALALLTNDQRAKWTTMLGKEFTFPEFSFGPGGPGGPGFGPPGGPGGMGQQRKLIAQFDKDEDGRLNRDERTAAREFLKTERANGGGRGFGGPGGFGPPGGPGFGPGGRGPGPGGPGPDGQRPVGPGGPGPGFGRREEPKPGPKIKPTDVKSIPDANLYEPTVLRTVFLEFENEDWETELSDFNNTDVEIPATVTVDGKSFPNVGVHFRGMSSFMGVGAGSKRSLNLSFDFVDPDQRLYGYKTLNLLNSHEDPSFLHTVLYLQAARQYIPAPKANFIKLAINGESWGIYVNAQQFNKEFLNDNFESTKGARWKVPGSPGGRGGLEYLGDDTSAYKSRYAIKSKDSEKDWKALVKLCKTLNETPPDKLEAALEPILNIDGALWFLALENALINSDGYWIRASDYCIYRDDTGKFHIIPHDANETFQVGMGPGMGGPGIGGPGGRGRPGGGPPDRPGEARGDRRPPGEAPPAEGRPREGGPRDGGPNGPRGGVAGSPSSGPRSGGLELDPLTGLNDNSKPLRSRLLAVPSLKAKYLAHVKTIADDWLDWNKLQPVVNQYATLIDKEVLADTKKLTSYDEFRQAVTSDQQRSTADNRPRMPLRSFADQRRQFLLNYSAIKELD